MTRTEVVAHKNPGALFNITGWFFGVLFFAIGVINTFWGNDPGFGVFIIILSSIYFPPLYALIKEKTQRSVPALLKVFVAVFILWAALGVGELLNKIALMQASF